MSSILPFLSLDLPVYEIHCGAKPFRVDSGLRALSSSPFSDPWLFDVETLARLMPLRSPEAENRIVRLPLTGWEDVTGSKIRFMDGGTAAVSLALIWLRRLPGLGVKVCGVLLVHHQRRQVSYSCDSPADPRGLP